VKFAAIADWADLGTYPVVFMCAELEVSRSGYYAWRLSGPSARAIADEGFTVMIRAICRDGRGNPGVRRVRAGLASLGHLLSHKRVWRLMRAAGLRGRHPKAWKRTTVHGDCPVSAPDLIKRDFSAPAPNQRWCGDIERHEALLNRAVVKGHRLRLVAASRKKLRAV
jgi:putative transposase